MKWFYNNFDLQVLNKKKIKTMVLVQMNSIFLVKKISPASDNIFVQKIVWLTLVGQLAGNSTIKMTQWCNLIQMYFTSVVVFKYFYAEVNIPTK